MPLLAYIEQLAELITGEFAIAQDLREQSGSDRLSGVYRDNGDPAVRMTKEVVASSNPHVVEACPLERLDQLDVLGSQRRRGTHQENRTAILLTRRIAARMRPSVSPRS